MAVLDSTKQGALLPNIIGGKSVYPEGLETLPVLAPQSGDVLADVPLCGPAELDLAVTAAKAAQPAWGKTPLKDRVQVMYRLKHLIESQEDELAELISRENGKTVDEAKGELARGVECIEFACSLPQLALGEALEVSRGVECRTARYPLGVVAGITPFNFPLFPVLQMVPMALSLGNAFILKPSEITPLGGMRLATLLEEAGLPAGVFSVVHGGRTIVEAICDHPGIAAVGFVGSSKAARAVYGRASQAGKRVRALGGAKNHLIVMPDAEPEMTVTNVIASVTGCAGQRCMAASVLVAVGDVEPILHQLRERFAALVPGEDFSCVISPASRERIAGYIERAGAGATVDGRNKPVACDDPGTYIGASILEVDDPQHEAAQDEIFGPVLTVLRCESLEEALAIENANPHGNAAAIYTSNGETAQVFIERSEAGMVGVNIGVPAPREPFGFGGWNGSVYGDGDLTGKNGMDFWSRTKKITSKWADKYRKNWMS